MALTRVFEPLKVNKLTIKNRVLRTAHGTFLSSGRHIGGPTWEAYHLARARGGVGLTIFEASYVHRACGGASAALDDDRIIESYKSILAKCEPYDMKLMQQLWCGGHIYTAEGGGPSWGVSAVPSATGVMPEEMSRRQIHELQDAFVAAALRVKKAGMHGIEFHGCHGYVVSQFYSPVLNRRTDEYGGSLENRSRFTMETLHKLRDAIGPDFTMGMRMGATPQAGVHEDELKDILKRVMDAGLIDFLNASFGDYYDQGFTWGAPRPTGYQLPSSGQLTATVKERSNKVPRFVVGRFRTLEEVENVLRDGVADMVSMVRATIADPDLVRKTQEGRITEVRPCIGCNQGCIGGLYRHLRVGCAVNVAVGREEVLAEDQIQKVATPKKVVIVGGGPAGMEAARVAALCGHKVKLIEASPHLGGMVNIAKRAPRLHQVGDITVWLSEELYRLGVEVQLNTYVEVDDLRAEQADAVIVATGSMPRMDGYQMFLPTEPIKGVDQSHVVSSTDLITMPKNRLGKSAVVFDDVGHLEAIACAEYLVEAGCAVTYVTGHSEFGGPYTKTTERVRGALERLYKHDFTFRVLHKIVDIRDGECVIQPIQSPKTETVKADTVVLISHNRPIRELFEQLRDEMDGRIWVVGDARAPRDIQYGMQDAHFAAREIA